MRCGAAAAVAAATAAAAASLDAAKKNVDAEFRSRANLLRQWCINHTALIILFSAGQRPQVFCQLLGPDPSQLEQFTRRSEGKGFCELATVSGETVRNVSCPFVVLSKSVSKRNVFDCRVVHPIMAQSQNASMEVMKKENDKMQKMNKGGNDSNMKYLDRNRKKRTTTRNVSEGTHDDKDDALFEGDDEYEDDDYEDDDDNDDDGDDDGDDEGDGIGDGKDGVDDGCNDDVDEKHDGAGSYDSSDVDAVEGNQKRARNINTVQDYACTQAAGLVGYLPVSTRNGLCFLTSPIASVSEQSLANYDSKLKGVATESICSTYDTMMFQGWREQKILRDKNEVEFLHHMSMMMETSIEQLRQTYICIDRGDYETTVEDMVSAFPDLAREQSDEAVCGDDEDD